MQFKTGRDRSAYHKLQAINILLHSVTLVWPQHTSYTTVQMQTKSKTEVNRFFTLENSSKQKICSHFSVSLFSYILCKQHTTTDTSCSYRIIQTKHTSQGSSRIMHQQTFHSTALLLRTTTYSKLLLIPMDWFCFLVISSTSDAHQTYHIFVLTDWFSAGTDPLIPQSISTHS